MSDTELLVVGAGSAGLGAAFAARLAGRRVMLVEADKPGGDCTYYGCVPSKTLIETANRVAHARDGTGRGYRAQVEVDFAGVLARVQTVITEIAKDESPRLLAQRGIGLRTGQARFVGPGAIEVDGEPVRADRIVLATGADAAVPPVPGLDTVPYLTNRTIFSLTEQPAHLVVLGGGAIGCELAQAFRRLGSTVTLVEALPRLLANEDPAASAAVRAALTADGVTVHTGHPVTAVASTPAGPTLTVGGTTVTGTHVLVATGRRPNTADLGLDTAGIATAKGGFIATDDYLRTDDPATFAVGDCVSRLQFTHVAYAQGRLAATNAFASRFRPGIAGGRARWDDRVVPRVTFTDPEVASVGLTEAAAYERWGERARVAVVPDTHSDRARCAGETAGFVKLVAAPTGAVKASALDRLVGAVVVGPRAGEAIAEAALAMRTNVVVGRIAQTVHAYPTWSMSMQYAAAMFYGATGQHARPARPDAD